MKNQLLSLLLIATTICAIPSAFGQTKDTLTNEYLDQRDDGLFYQEQSETPFTGFVLMDNYNKEETEYVKGEKVRYTIWSENGQKISEHNYVNGEEEGLQTEWYENGQKQSEKSYLDGQPNGAQAKWYENGQKKMEGIMNGQQDAKIEKWYENGQKESNINYIDGQPEGEQAKWYEDGQKKYECNVVSGKVDGLLSVWYKNGQKHIESTVFYQESKLVRNENAQDWAGLVVSKGGTMTVWQPNGKKLGFAQANLVDGKYYVLHETWYENEQKKFEWNGVDGQREGKQTSWYENGQKESEGNYLNAQREGKQVKWYEDGKKKYEANYLNGKKDGLQKTWYENGQMASETNYKDVNKEGLWTSWYENGQLESEANYKNGNKEGKCTEWYENGKKKVKSNYRKDKRQGKQTEWDVNGKLINKENTSRTNESSSDNNNTAYATQFFSLDDSKSMFKIHKASDNFFAFTIDGNPQVSAQEPMIMLTADPFILWDEGLDEGQLKDWVNTMFNTWFVAEDVDIIYESELGANGYDSYSVLKKKSFDEVNKYMYIQSIVHEGNEVRIIASQEGGEFDAEEIRKLIRTIKMK